MNILDKYLEAHEFTRYQLALGSGISATTWQSVNDRPLDRWTVKQVRALADFIGIKSTTMLGKLEAIESEQVNEMMDDITFGFYGFNEDGTDLDPQADWGNWSLEDGLDKIKHAYAPNEGQKVTMFGGPEDTDSDSAWLSLEVGTESAEYSLGHDAPQWFKDLAIEKVKQAFPKAIRQNNL